jgi:hypothetical protein
MRFLNVPQRCRVPEGPAGALCPICGARRRQSRARHGPCAADGAAPDLFERLLYEDEDLRHIDVLIIPLADWPDLTRVRQVAYVRAGTPLLALLQGGDQMQVHLPG